MKIDVDEFNRKAEYIIETVVKPQVKKYEQKIMKEKIYAIITLIIMAISLTLVGTAIASQIFKGAF
jgi:hypothetical protein